MTASLVLQIALEHVEWALRDGQSLRDIGRSVRAKYPTWTRLAAIQAVAAAWRELPRREPRCAR
jgi:hypothetical protein